MNTSLEALLPAASRVDLLRYRDLIATWNRVYSLTAVRDIDEMIPRHLLDSLAIAPYVKGERILDVGAGAGLPGIPLALTLPQWQFVLLDSNGKKTRFLIHVKSELSLTNVEVVQARVEQYQPEQLFDTIVTRAFGSLDAMIEKTKRLCRPGGCLLAMKGQYPQDELAAISERFEVYPITVPALDAQRHLVCIWV